MLDTRDVVDESVVATVRTVEALGKKLYEEYDKSVVKDRSLSIHEPIKKNSLPLFRRPTPKTKNKQAGQISSLKHDVELFSRLYIVMQHREGDMATFFKHENHPYPPSLSDRGKLRHGKKSDLLTIILDQVEVEEPPSWFDVKVLDGAAIVHLLPTTNATTFEDYANAAFIPHINQNLRTCKRVDVVWDTYISNSIEGRNSKEGGKQKQGSKQLARFLTGFHEQEGAVCIHH